MMRANAITRRRALLCAAGLAAAPAAHAASGLRALFGDGRTEGSGRLIEDVRNVGAFSRLVVQGPIEVRLQAADTERVEVLADDNIAPLIETVNQGGALLVGVKPGASFRTHAKVQVRVQAPRVHGVVLRGSGKVRADRIEAEIFEATVQGSGEIRIDRLEADAVAVSISGNGDFRAAGRAGRFGAVIDGSGDVHCADLPAQQVAVQIRGSGDARVHAIDELKVRIDGTGDVRYRGSPKITRTIRGSGAVKPLR